MRRSRLMAVVLAAAIALTMTGCTAAPGTGSNPGTIAKAPPKPYLRYVALQGSATHLLYGKVVSTKAVSGSSAIPRYVLDRKRRSTRVPAGWSASLLGDRPLLTRTVSAEGVTSVQWRLPEAHRSGTTDLPKGSRSIASAPDGWVTSVRTFVDSADGDYGFREHLTRWTTGGATTDLGVPNPDAAPFALAVSDAGLLAFSYPGDGGDFQPDSTVKFMPWSSPGTWTTLFPLPGAAAKNVYDIQCGLSSTLAACSIEDPSQFLLLPVGRPARSARVVRGSRCLPGGPTPLSASAVGTIAVSFAECKAGTLARYTLTGKLQRSTRTYSRLQEPVMAMNRIVVASPSERTLFTLTSVKGRPKRLLGH